MVDKIAQAITKGNQAKQRLDDPLFQDAVAKLKADYVTEWAAAKNTEAREKIWTRYNLIEDVSNRLVALMNDGKMAKIELDRLQKAA
jgi:hypothetical protein